MSSIQTEKRWLKETLEDANKLGIRLASLREQCWLLEQRVSDTKVRISRAKTGNQRAFSLSHKRELWVLEGVLAVYRHAVTRNQDKLRLKQLMLAALTKSLSSEP